MDHSVAQVGSPMAAEDHLSPLLGPPPGASQVSWPSPLPQINADTAMQFELAQLRAELDLVRTQMGKRASESFRPSLHREDDAGAFSIDVGEAATEKQEAKDAAKFYKDEWQKLRIQVNDQNKAIAELKALQQRPRRYNLSPEFEEVRETEPVAAGQGKGDGGGRPDPMWQSQGDAWGQWKQAQPPGLSESQAEQLPNDEYDQYHSYNQNWSGKGYHQEWRGRSDHDGGY